MNMTNLDHNPQDSDSLESRLRCYGNTLDTSLSVTAESAHSAARGTASDASSGRFEHPRRKARFAVGTALAGLSALIVSGLSFGGTSNTTIVTAGSPSERQSVTAEQLKAAYLKVEAQSTMAFPVAGQASFVDTFGAPRLAGTPFATRHDGIDIFTSAGSPIYAMGGGTLRLRSFDVKPKSGTLNAGGRFETTPTAWTSGSVESTIAHMQFAEIAESNGTITVYSNIDPTVADKENVRPGQLIGTLTMFQSGIPPHLHIARYSPGTPLASSLPFIPSLSGTKYKAINVFPLLTSLQPNSTQPAVLIDVQGITVSSAIAARLRSLLDAAKADGFEGVSGGGYRSPARQVALRKAHCGKTDYDIYVKPASQCSPPTARPGNNEHERGLAVDFSQGGRIADKDHPFMRWLTKNAPKYGFTGVADEPWHWSATAGGLSTKEESRIGATIGTLTIESARVNVPLIEGAAPEQMKSGAGREPLSARLGEAGETVIRCNRTTYGAPCLNLELVKPRDKVAIRTDTVVYEYTVKTVLIVSNTIKANRVSTPVIDIPASLKGHAILTLTTQHPKYTMKQSLVVQAELSGIAYDNPLHLGAGKLK
jgi:sortase (surface protein transpeptidase)/murein DD-endopeptidase MepM/ murein hydrolase activator NlpD